MDRLKTRALGVVCFAVMTVVGCGGESAPPASPSPGPAPSASTQSASSESSSSSAQAGSEAGQDPEGEQLIDHHRFHHGGVAMFLSMSVESLGVSDDQRAGVNKIQDDLAAKLAPLHAAQKALLLVLADGVSAGNVDKAKVAAALATVNTNASSAEAATTDALNQLHAILTPPQRVALVQKLEAHWQVWKQANAEGGERGHTPGAELGLTSDQSERIRAAMQSQSGSSSSNTGKVDPATMAANLKSFGTAFEGQSFDAKTMSRGEGLIGQGVGRMVGWVQAAAPILTPDQRTKLADRLRAHAAQEAT